MRIAIDIDDVVMDFWRSLESSVATEYGIELDYEANKQWDEAPLKHLDIFGVDRGWWDWLRDRDWVWATFRPVPGAIGAIDSLRRNGYYVELITKKPDWAEWTVWKWLGRWRPAANRVTIIGSDQNKAEYSDADLLIDDNIDNCIDWLRTGRPIILFDRPWNREVPIQLRDQYRAENWRAVLELIPLIEKEQEFNGV